MLSFNNNFIGYSDTSNTVLFTGSDNEEAFNNRLATEPEDWIYRTLPISYVRNSNGHRSKEINDIDLDNYFLATGCSHTEGVGLPYDKTYPYQLSTILGVDHYNLGVGGMGIDTLTYNLTAWLDRVKKEPKFVVVQLPEPTRFLTYWSPESEDRNRDIRGYSIWNASQSPLLENFIISGDMIKYFEYRSFLHLKMIKNMFVCPVITLSVYRDFPGDVVMDKSVDKARDNHLGINSHGIIALQLSQYIKKKNA